MIRLPMRAAIVAVARTRFPDILVEKLAHRRRGHEAVEGLLRQIAIIIVAAPDADDQIALRVIVADALDQAAAVDVAAFERRKVDRAAVLDVDPLRANRGR